MLLEYGDEDDQLHKEEQERQKLMESIRMKHKKEASEIVVAHESKTDIKAIKLEECEKSSPIVDTSIQPAVTPVVERAATEEKKIEEAHHKDVTMVENDN